MIDHIIGYILLGVLLYYGIRRLRVTYLIHRMRLVESQAISALRLPYSPSGFQAYRTAKLTDYESQTHSIKMIVSNTKALDFHLHVVLLDEALIHSFSKVRHKQYRVVNQHDGHYFDVTGVFRQILKEWLRSAQTNRVETPTNIYTYISRLFLPAKYVQNFAALLQELINTHRENSFKKCQLFLKSIDNQQQLLEKTNHQLLQMLNAYQADKNVEAKIIKIMEYLYVSLSNIRGTISQSERKDPELIRQHIQSRYGKLTVRQALEDNVLMGVRIPKHTVVEVPLFLWKESRTFGINEMKCPFDQTLVKAFSSKNNSSSEPQKQYLVS